jgi:hypothetical protein
MPAGDGGLGESLVGEKITINHRHVSVAKLLGEGTSCTVNVIGMYQSCYCTHSSIVRNEYRSTID